MRTIGNILWFVLGGWFAGLMWWAAAVVMLVSIIGIPFVRAAWNIGTFTFLPFGQLVINREDVTEQQDIGTSIFGTLGNIVWFVLAGLWLGIAHIVIGVTLFCSIIGIPFALQHFKLAHISFAPIGQQVVNNYLYDAVKQEQAQKTLSKIRRG